MSERVLHERKEVIGNRPEEKVSGDCAHFFA